MACRKEDATVGLVLSDDVGRGGGGQDRVLADDELFHAVGGTDLQYRLDGLWGEVTTVTADDEGRAVCIDRIEDGLGKVLGVVLQGECLSMAISRRSTSIAYGLLEHLDPAIG